MVKRNTEYERKFIFNLKWTRTKAITKKCSKERVTREIMR